MHKRHKQKTKSIAVLFSLILCFSLITGCSGGGGSTSASGAVAEKLELAAKYLTENKFEEAILAYQEVIKIDPKNVLAYGGINVAHTMQGRMEQAEQALRDGLQKVADSKQLKLVLAGLLVDANKNEQAEALYKEVITQDGKYLPAYQAYAKLLLRQGKKAEAVALLETVVTGNPENYQGYSMLAEVYQRSGDKEKSKAALVKSISLEPNQAVGYQLLEELYAGSWEELIALADPYLQNQEPAGQLLKLTGLYNLGKYEEVILLYEQLASGGQAGARAKMLAAHAYSKLNNKEMGNNVLKEVKLSDIKDAALLSEIAGYYLEAGDKENARSIAIKGVELDEAVVDNYVVLYNSYSNEEASLANIWLYKYLLQSSYGFNTSLEDLIKAGIKINDNDQSPLLKKIVAKQIISRIIFDVNEERESFTESDFDFAESSASYLDTAGNIAYYSYVFADLKDMQTFDFNTLGGIVSWSPNDNSYLWKNILVRIHNPQIYDRSIVLQAASGEVSAEYMSYVDSIKKYDKFIKVGEALYAPIISDGPPLEEHMKNAGVSLDSVIFVDVQ